MNQIIIVDDEPDLGDIIARYIVKRNLAAKSDIILLTNSNEAREYISQLSKGPRIVFSSVDMLGGGIMNGLDLLTAVKKKFPNTILVSMSGTHSYAEEAKRRGANYFLSKPFPLVKIKRIFADNPAK